MIPVQFWTAMDGHPSLVGMVSAALSELSVSDFERFATSTVKEIKKFDD